MTQAASEAVSLDHPAKEVRRPWIVASISALAGFALTVIWSAHFVDQTIGGTVADGLLGRDASSTPIAGVSGAAFAFVSGLAGTFTACNIAAVGAVAPLVGAKRGLRERMVQTLRPLGWLIAGMLVVSGTYGLIVGLMGSGMPQASTAPSGEGLSPRNLQSMVVFGIIGVTMVYLGLASLGVVRDPLARISRRFPAARMLLIGAMIGGFLIGRPFGLFRHLFRDVAESNNPFYAAAAFMLQSVGNITIVAVLFFVLATFTGGRVHRWLAARPGRAAVITGAAFIVAGVFTFLYWDVRLLARRDLIWYPTAPWS